MLLSSTTVNGAVSNDSNNNITMSVGNTVIANVNSSGIFFESGKKAIYTGAVLQVASAVKSDTLTTSSTTFTDITGLSVSITPLFSSSKILVMVNMTGQGVAGVSIAQFRLVRDSTVINAGAAAGSRTLGFAAAIPADSNHPITHGANYLDSPSSTSSITYKVQVRTSAGGTAYVNIAQGDSDDVNRTRTSSTITVMEIAG